MYKKCDFDGSVVPVDESMKKWKKEIMSSDQNVLTAILK